MDQNYTVKQVANMLRVSEEQVRRWIREGSLVGTRESKKDGYRISGLELFRFTHDHPKYCIPFPRKEVEYQDDTVVAQLRERSTCMKEHILGLVHEYLKLEELIRKLENEESV